MTISKELFEAVKGFKVHEYEIGTTFIKYYPKNGLRVKSINWKPTLEVIIINDFFFDCINFMIKNNFNIDTTIFSDLTAACKIDSIELDEYEYIQGDSIQESVFDACQWILNKGTVK